MADDKAAYGPPMEDGRIDTAALRSDKGYPRSGGWRSCDYGGLHRWSHLLADEVDRLRAALTFIAGEGCRGPGLIENLSCADTLRPEDGEQYCYPCVAREALNAPSTHAPTCPGSTGEIVVGCNCNAALNAPSSPEATP